MILRRALVISLLVLAGCTTVTSVDPAATVTQIPVLRVQASEENLGRLQNNKMIDVAVPAELAVGGTLYHCTIGGQGAGSRYQPKWSYRIRLENGASLYGLSDFNLSAQVYDRTMMKTLIVARIFERAGFPAFRARPVMLTINNRIAGLYIMVERIDEAFFAARALPSAELVKVLIGASFSLKAKGDPAPFFDKQMPDDGNLGSVRELLAAVDEATPATLGRTVGAQLNIPLYLRYHAITALTNNVDAFRNNFYLYRHAGGRPFDIIPWDFDNAFNWVTESGYYGFNELIDLCRQDRVADSIYRAAISGYASTIFTERELFPLMDSTEAAIAEAYRLDPYLGGRFVLHDEVATIKTEITRRRTWYLAQ